MLRLLTLFSLSVGASCFFQEQPWMKTDGTQWVAYEDDFSSICTVFAMETLTIDLKCNGTMVPFEIKPEDTLQRGKCRMDSTSISISNVDNPLLVSFGFTRWVPPKDSDPKNEGVTFFVLDWIDLNAKKTISPIDNSTCNVAVRKTDLSKIESPYFKAPIGNVHHCEDSNTVIELSDNAKIEVFSLTMQTFRDSSKGNSTELDDPEFACGAELTRKRGFGIFVLIFLPVSLGGTYWYFFVHKKTPSPSQNRR